MKTIDELRADAHAAVRAIRSVPLGNPKPVTTAQIELNAERKAAFVAARAALSALNAARKAAK